MISSKATRLSQPIGTAEIDYSNPLAFGIIEAVNGSQTRYSVGGFQVQRPVKVVTPLGIADATRFNQMYPATSEIGNSSFTFLTIELVSPSTDISGGASVYKLGHVTNASNTFISSTDGTTAGAISAVIYLGGTRVLGGSFVKPVGSMYTGVLRHRPGVDTCLFVDGVEDPIKSTVKNAGLGFGYLGPRAVPDGAANVLTVAWKRALSNDEIAAVSRNPWQLFKPVQRRVYFDMGAGGTTGVAVEGTNSVQLSTSDSGYMGQEHLLVSSSSAQLGTLTAMGIAQANTLSGNPLVQTITSVGGAVTQISILSGSATASSSGTSQGVVQQVNKLLGSACLSPGGASSAGMLQVSHLAAIPNAQLLLTTAAGILQSHILLGGATFQSSYATSGGMSLTPLIELSADVVQAQSLSGAGQVSQDHKLSHGQSEQPATSSNGATVQIHVLVSSNAVQFVLSSSEAVVVEEGGLLQGSSVSQGNTITLGVILQGNILRGTSARQLTLSNSGAITQTGVLPPLTDAELREILASMQLAIARLQVRLDAMY